MRSTMMDFPLTVRHIFEHGRALYGDSEVVTCEADGVRRIEFNALADRAEQLAAALRRLGVGPGDRVATFGWNNQEHQEAYFAIPCMGAVMHTMNIRLSTDQLRYIIGHAEDSVIILDAASRRSSGRFWPTAGTRSRRSGISSSTVTATGLRCRRTSITKNCSPPRNPATPGRTSMSTRPPRCATPAGPPACRRASYTATAPRSCTRWA